MRIGKVAKKPVYTECIRNVRKKTMGRYREHFTLYYRLRKNGAKIWYYRTYSPDGVRTCGKSTGLESKAKARAYCEELFKKGKLWGGSCKFFGDFAEGFFDDDSAWFRDRMACGTPECPAMSQAYIKTIRVHLSAHIMPFFAKHKLEDLRPSTIKLFRAELLDGVGQGRRPLAPKTINNILATLRLITDAALADGLMMFDPFRTIRPLKGNERPRDMFDVGELKRLVSAVENTSLYVPVLIGICTGIRASEVLAIRSETLHENYIDVIDQIYNGEYVPLKTKEARKVPVCAMLRDIIKNDLPDITYTQLQKNFNKAIIRAGLQAEKQKRGLCFHSFRHTFNTFLLVENVPSHKVAAVMGHSSGAGSMQERYTNWRAEMLGEVYAAQEKLLKQILS